MSYDRRHHSKTDLDLVSGGERNVRPCNAPGEEEVFGEPQFAEAPILSHGCGMGKMLWANGTSYHQTNLF